MAEVRETASSEQPVVCVFCASSPGKNPAHLESARTLGEALADANYKLVYGGGTMGIMGEIAKTIVSRTNPENVLGIIPRALVRTEKDPSTRDDGSLADSDSNTDVKKAERTVTREQLKRMDSHLVIPKSEYGETRLVRSMHERKGMMKDEVLKGAHGSGFVALAGGYGTMEEVMEMVTWNQLGIHKLPIVVVNVDGYWDGLLQWVKKSVDEGFVGKGNANILVEVKSTSEVVGALKNYQVAEGRFKLDWNHT